MTRTREKANELLEKDLPPSPAGEQKAEAETEAAWCKASAGNGE